MQLMAKVKQKDGKVEAEAKAVALVFQ